MDSQLRIRKAKNSEINLYIEWGDNAGWNMNSQITLNFHKDFPDGWFLCESVTTSNPETGRIPIESGGGKVIGLLYCTKYRSNIGFIGYFMVDREYRGLGYGHKLFQYVLDNYLFNGFDCPVKAVGLFSAQNAEQYYKRFGFDTKGLAVRLKGKVNPILLLNGLNDEAMSEKLSESNLEEVALLDEKYSLAYRPGFWRNWLDKEQGSDYTSVLYTGESGQIEGMGMLRRLPQGARLGPLYANSFDIAQTIVKKLLTMQTKSRHEVIMLDVHCGNTKACDWFKNKLGLQEVLTTSYMWKGDGYTLDEEKVNNIYAMASLDFN